MAYSGRGRRFTTPNQILQRNEVSSRCVLVIPDPFSTFETTTNDFLIAKTRLCNCHGLSDQIDTHAFIVLVVLAILKGLKRKGIEQPTPIQIQGLPTVYVFSIPHYCAFPFLQIFEASHSCLLSLLNTMHENTCGIKRFSKQCSLPRESSAVLLIINWNTCMLIICHSKVS